MVSCAVETAAPAEVEPWPVFARAFVAALRTALLLAVAAAAVVLVVMLAVAPMPDDAALTVPTGAFEVDVPGGVPPEVDTYTSRSELGYCV